MSEERDRRTFVSIAAVFAAMALCKFTGLLRDVLIAKFFGATSNTDAYMAAYLVPVQLASALGTALALSLIPVYLALPREERPALVHSLVNRGAVVLLLISLLGVLFPGAAVRVLAPGFNAGTSEVAGDFLRVIALVFACIALSGMLGGVMNARRRFVVPGAGPGILNLVIIVAVLAFSSRLGIQSVAWGILFGGAAELFIYLLYLRLIGHRHSFRSFGRHPASPQVFRLFWPIFIGLALGQLSLLVNNALASTLDAGNITVMGYAFKMMTLVIGLFLPISTVLFPELSRAAAVNDQAESRMHITRGLKLIVFLAIPATVGLIVLGRPMVDVLFRRGVFDDDAAQATAWALYAFAPGLIGIVANEFLSRAFYSLKDARTPTLIGAATLALNVALNLLLIRVLPGPQRYLGLVSATSLSILINILLMLIVLKRRLRGLRYAPLVASTAVVLLLSSGMGLSAWAVQRWVQGFAHEAVALAAALSAGAVAYALLALAARRTEALRIAAQLRALLAGRRPSPPAD